MAKTRTKPPPAPPVPTPAKVQAALRAGNVTSAVELARQLHTLTPTPENLALRKQALAAAAGHYADRDKAAEFNTVMAEADGMDASDPAWVAERACLLARGGRLADALMRVDAAADPATHAKVLGHAADRAVRLQSRDALSPEHQAGLHAVLTAFKQHEGGNEPAAREALEGIGLRSPFLEWKVLLRGLLAHAAADDARAAENFARLDPARLPSRLAAPVRIAVDPGYKAALPADAAAELLKQHDKLTAGPILTGLRTIARHLGRDKPLAPAFRAAEGVLPLLKQTAPHLVPRLGNCLYHAIIHQGEPEDLKQYRKLFGNQPDDPDFHKLLARVGELTHNLSSAHGHWQQFDAWLEKHPPAWPASFIPRARAIVWARMGENARRAADEPDEEPAAFGFFTVTRVNRKSKPLNPPPLTCFRKAAELDPTWADAAGMLFEELVEGNKGAEAETVARAHLARHPDDLDALKSLAELLQKQGRAGDAAELWLRALAQNPLDRPTRFRTASALLAAARRKLIEAVPAEAEVLFETHRTLLAEQTPAGMPALRSVVLTKLGRPDEAAAERAKALAVPGGRLGAAYRMSVDSQLAKLKPADKRAADKLFADALAQPPTPLEVNQLLAAYDVYHIDGVTYRGQKTHEKKLLDQVPKCLTSESPEVDFERLGDVLLLKQEFKHAKLLADGLTKRFPNNPHFLLLRSEVGSMTNERPYHTEQRLVKAKRLAEAATEPRHRQLLDRIDRLLKQVALPFDFFEDLFR